MSFRENDTLISMFLRRAAEDRDGVALLHAPGDDFLELTWGELAQQVARFAQRLQGEGVRPGDRVVLVSENRAEWILADLGIMMARAVHVPLHAMLAGAQILEQACDCDAKVLILEGDAQAQKLVPLADEIPDDVKIFTLDACNRSSRKRLPLDLFQDPNADACESDFEALQREALDGLAPDDLATILYTSGTTGEPKGVMLTHGNLVFNTRATLEAVGTSREDLRLSFLPWSHIFARTCDLYTWIACGHSLAIAQCREKIMDNCRQLQPTLINSVPYFYERLYRGLEEHGALDKPGALAGALGGRVRLCCSGGAALPRHVAEMFARQDVPILQGYGLTETSPVISTCTPDANRIGTVGPPLGGVEVQIAADGEILTRGPHIMKGYFNKPEATAEVIRDGWFHTGDLGQLDADGLLSITGRKKEIIVLATGKNVAPAAVELRLTQDPFIIQAMVIGDNRNYLTALIVPDPDTLRAEIRRRRLWVFTARQALQHPQIQALYAERIQQRLADLSRIEQVGRFHLLNRGFTIESGEMTPTLKLKRDVIMRNLADAIEKLYREEAA